MESQPQNPEFNNNPENFRPGLLDRRHGRQVSDHKPFFSHITCCGGIFEVIDGIDTQIFIIKNSPWPWPSVSHCSVNSWNIIWSQTRLNFKTPSQSAVRFL